MKKLLIMILKWITFLITLGVIAFVILLISIFIKQGNIAPLTKAPEAIIVLGAQVKADGSLSVQLEDRLTGALKVYERYPDALIFTCGGQGSDEPAPEGAVMKEWLITQGVHPDQIISETHSKNTYENIKNTAALIEEMNVNIKEICLVTSDYHLPRAMALAKDFGFKPQGIGTKTLPEYWIKNYLRETLSWGKYYTQKYLNWPKAGL